MQLAIQQTLSAVQHKCSTACGRNEVMRYSRNDCGSHIDVSYFVSQSVITNLGKSRSKRMREAKLGKKGHTLEGRFTSVSTDMITGIGTTVVVSPSGTICGSVWPKRYTFLRCEMGAERHPDCISSSRCVKSQWMPYTCPSCSSSVPHKKTFFHSCGPAVAEVGEMSERVCGMQETRIAVGKKYFAQMLQTSLYSSI